MALWKDLIKKKLVSQIIHARLLVVPRSITTNAVAVLIVM